MGFSTRLLVPVVSLSRSLCSYVSVFLCVCVVTSNFSILDEVIDVDEIDKANISAAAGKQDK